MPPWLLLVLFVAGCVLWVALEASAATGRWRTFPTVLRQLGLPVLVIAGIGGALFLVTYMVGRAFN